MKTALITGASSGIGLEFAKIFASNNVNLVLVARNEEKLKSLMNELSNQYGVEVRLYAKDLSVFSNAEWIYNDLKHSGIEIDYLVNNAGFGIHGNYTQIDWSEELQMYNLNVITLAYFTKVFACNMAEKGFGRVLNVSSIGAFQPGPFMAGYCASKAFVLSLSEAINNELKNSNVSVTALCPGMTDSEFHSVAKTKETAMSKYMPHATSKAVAEYGYRIMNRRKAVGVYGCFNKLMVFSNRLVCRNLATKISAYILK